MAMSRVSGRPPLSQVTPGLSSQVDMSELEDEFQAVVTQCLAVLLLGTETKLDAALQTMTRINWAAVEAVSIGGHHYGAGSNKWNSKECSLDDI